ncbi:CapA family protein [Actinoplanes sp. CA-252034]|uniref:CapA family protein n=1 Tax=Actinoplanes sp. CA-252034 TaxID=3239906 RepID=UPI003D98D193
MTPPRLPGRAALIATLALSPVACEAQPARPEPEVVIAFGGDVHFEGRVQRLLTDPGSAFGPAAPLLSAADLTFVNLETPITRRDEPEPKRYVFRADPAAATALQAAGIDAVSLANNHAMDHGRGGLTDTITAARAARVGVFGAGQDIGEAYRPWRTEVRGVRVAVFGFSQVDDLADRWTAGPDRAGMAMAFDTDRAVRAVAAARTDNDLVVVMPHWGVEGDQCPSREQQDLARRLADAGADIVVGAHAHVLQGAGRLGSTFVAYGLGNLLWYSSGLFPPFSARSGILTLTVRGRTVVRSDFTPVLTSDSGRPQLLTGARADIARHNYATLTRCAELADPAADSSGLFGP